MTDNRSPLDIAADLLVYAPVGLAVQLGKQLPELAQSGRNQLQTTLTAAKIVGRISVEQGRRDLGERLRKMTETGPNAPAPTTEQAPASTTQPQPTTDPEPVVGATPSGDASTLAIAGYTSLSANQIIAHLPALSSQELAAIEAYEAANRMRKSVLARIEQLQTTGE